MQSLKSDAENAVTWFNLNMMKTNPDKFQVLFLCPPRLTDPFQDNFQFSNISIKREHFVKLLGVVIDDKLNFDKHVKEICCKAARQLNALYRLRNLISADQRLLLYQCFIMSNFNYCPLVWHFCSRKSIHKIERIQERALRYICNDFTRSYNNLLDFSGFTTLFTQRIRMFAVEVFKCMNDLNPEYICAKKCTI